MTSPIAAMKMALDCMLHDGVPVDPEHPKRMAVNALIAALIEAEKVEPVAWMREGCGPDCGPYVDMRTAYEMRYADNEGWTPLYTRPPTTKPGIKWVAMTREQHANLRWLADEFTTDSRAELLEALGAFPDEPTKQEPT